MFTQTLIILFLGSHINGFALDAPSRNFRPNPNVGSPRIVGGSDAPPGSANHMVAILTGQVITTLMCGGTIITKKDILTAAHCIEPAIVRGELLPSFRGVVGSYFWNRTEILVSFTGYHIHEGWNSWTIKDDIGILVTAGISLSERVAILPINFNFIGGNKKSFVTGWGTGGFMEPIPDRLQILNVSTIDGAECVRRVQLMEALGWMTPPVDSRREICTFHSPGHGMCHGDSGSALREEETGFLIGLVSWGYPCAVGGPDIFVRISWYRSWLLNRVKKNL